MLKTFDHPRRRLLHGRRLAVYRIRAIGYSADGKDRQFAIFDTRRLECVNTGFITDGTEKDITVPYGIAVNPVSKGNIHHGCAQLCESRLSALLFAEGVRKWSQRTGDIPSKIVFY